jgi:hypothetical protein
MTVEDSRRALVTYALVGEALEKHNDFLLGLVPLFGSIANERAGQLFDPRSFSEDVQRSLGLHIPEEVADFLATRLQNVGMVKRLLEKGGTVTYVWQNIEIRPNNSKVDLAEKIDLILNEFEDFCRSFPSIGAATHTREELQNGLFDWMLQEDKNLSSAMQALGYDPDAEIMHPHRFKAETIYLAASFVKALAQKKSDTLEYISEIANAVIVSEALIGVADPNQKIPQGADVFIYLDAPFAMDLLGLSGVDRREYAAEIVSGLKELGCKIAMFQHNVDELKDNLRGLLGQSRRYGLSADALRRGEVTEAYIRYVLSNAEEAVKEAAISIYDADKSVLPVTAEQYFNKEGEDRIFQKLQAEYNNTKALDRDIQSISIIMKRRQGAYSTSPFRSKHLLITNNAILAAVALAVCRERGMRSGAIPPVMHRRRVAAMLWLQFGSRRRKALARKQLVASCSTILRIRPEIIDNMRNRLEQIDKVKASQFDVMINQPRFQQLAMDLTFSSENFAANSDANALFEGLEAELVAKERERQRILRAKDRAEFESQAADLHREVTSALEQVEDEQAKAMAANLEALRILNSVVGPLIDGYFLVWPRVRGFTIIAILMLFALGALSAIYHEALFGNLTRIVDLSFFGVGFLLTVMTLVGKDVEWFGILFRKYFHRRVARSLERLGYSVTQLDLISGLVVLSDGRRMRLGSKRGFYESDSARS